MNLKFPDPPIVIASSVPSQTPLHVIFVLLRDILTLAGSVTTMSVESIQPLVSLTITLYVPAKRSVIELVVSPLLHKYE